MAFKPELVDNRGTSCPRGKYETYVKKQTSKFRRRQIKNWLRGISKTEPNDKQFFGWTT